MVELRTHPHNRKGGNRHSLHLPMRAPLSDSTLMIAARLCGYRGVAAFGQFAALLDQSQLAAAGAFYSPTRQCYTAPATSTFHHILALMPPDTLDQALYTWTHTHSEGTAPVAIDGKDIRGASRQIDGEKRTMMAVVEYSPTVMSGNEKCAPPL